MKDKVKEVCDLTINNYRQVKEELRFDGDYINHLSAVVYASADKKINTELIKKIRSDVKEKTSRMSSFRGDILYIISILISLERNIEKFIEEILDVYDKLLAIGFIDNQYLVLSAYSIVKHVDKEKRDNVIKRMREIYSLMRKNYTNITKHEDYLECALLAIKGIEPQKLEKEMKKLFKRYLCIESLSKNSIQGLSMAILLNGNSTDDVEKLLNQLKKSEIKINHKFLPLLGAVASKNLFNRYISKVNEIIDYLCQEESEYEFYMDKGFRFFIGVVILEKSTNKKERFINELLCQGVYSMILSKNQGVFEEVLA
ncbi:MAG: DUF4003 family protein [Clostridiaceae bacterium]|nr:DUF4003 family protein [Clostridiaceae bacterium]